MEPIRYVDSLNGKYRALGFPSYDWTINTEAPLTPLAKPLAHCRVSMLTTCGASRKGTPPFDPDARNDLRVDAIPADTPADGFEVNDNYYDHTDVRRDINCQFPLERLRELAVDGTIGDVAPRLWSGFMGRIYTRSKVLQEAAPALATSLKEDDVDVLVVVPACPLDHQTAGLVARVVEEHGIVTVCVSTGRDLTQQVRPPRSVFVNFPMGNAFGRPHDVEQQRRILKDALDMVERDVAAGQLDDLAYDWGAPFEPYYRDTDRDYQLRK